MFHHHRFKRLLHSLHRFKRFKPHHRNQTKAPIKEEIKPPTYMRDTIFNIYKILKYSSWDSAQQLLHSLPIKWDSYTVNQALKTHPPMEKAWLFFNWVWREKGFKHDRFTYTTMLDIFGEAKRIESMKYVFEQMRQRGFKIDAVTYTSMMHWLSNAGDVDGAVKVWQEMRDSECCLTVVSYTAYLKVLFGNNRVQEARDVYKEMLQSGVSPNCFTYTVLMEYLVGAGKYEEAIDIFSKMQEAGVHPDKAACNILIDKCCKAGETRTMSHILKYMKSNRLVLRYPVFMAALQTLQVAGESDALLREVHPHISVKSIGDKEVVECAMTVCEAPSLDQGLVSFLLQKQNLASLDHLLAGVTDNNTRMDPTIIISTIIGASSNHCRADGALLAFKYSVKMCVKLERTTYLTLIGLLIRSNIFTEVVEIVKEMTNVGHSLGVYLSALLIYRVGCARRPVSAVKIFNLLPDDQKCTATYTALISVYFSAGSADKAVRIFKTMQQKGIKPLLGTYNVLLAGLEKLGRVSDAEVYRKERKSLRTDGYCMATVPPIEEKICDLLFAGDMVH